MSKLDDQISTLKDKLTQLKLRQQRIEERKRAIRGVRERKVQTRRRILLGTIVMERVERGELDRALLLKWLDEGLARADDRRLFDLPVRGAPSADV
jgi:hypothetical protein